MTDKTKVRLAQAVEITGVLLAIPFVISALPSLMVVGLIAFTAHHISDKLHRCTYGPQQWDSKKEEFYHLCTVCGSRVQGDDDSQ